MGGMDWDKGLKFDAKSNRELEGLEQWRCVGNSPAVTAVAGERTGQRQEEKPASL